jgi:enoyl-CoA hydratase/carnithine racemase
MAGSILSLRRSRPGREAGPRLAPARPPGLPQNIKYHIFSSSDIVDLRSGKGARFAMGHEFINVDPKDAVVTVSLDRPATRNACSMSMWLAIRDAFREIAASDARAVLLTGAGGDFCSGADVVTSRGSEGFDGSRLQAMRLLAESVIAVYDCPIPVVVKVDGVSVGAGFGLALSSDLLFCSDRSRFSVVFAKLGLSLDNGTSWFLTRRIGVHEAKEVALSAEMMGAARAAELGFVDAVLPAAELDAAVAAVAERIAAGPPLALSMTKRMLDNAASSSLAHALETEAIAQNVNLGAQDIAEAFRAFREKRAPVFQGR